MLVPLTIRSRLAVVPLSDGKSYALVDAEDWPKVNRFRWHAVKLKNTTYAYKHGVRRTTLKVPGVYMHHLLTLEPRVDHKDGNGLHNWRGNLRPCSQAQNNANKGKRSDGKSRFIGVHWYSRSRSWRAQCHHKHVGYFSTDEEAARAYDAAATREFGEFARLNFPIGKQHAQSEP